MATCSLKDMMETKDGTNSWSAMVVNVTKAPQTVKSSPGARGEDWVRATLSIAQDGAACELVWTDPQEPYRSNPKLLEGKSILLEQGITVDTYKGARRLRARGKEVQGAESGSAAPAPSSPQQQAVQPSPGQAHPLMSPALAQMTDRALLQAVAAWAPQVWAVLDPGLLATGEHAQAVSSFLSTMTIAVGQGKLAPTMFAEEGE